MTDTTRRTARAPRRVPAPLLLPMILAGLAAGPVAPGADADPSGAVKALTDIRDALHRQLDARIRADAAVEPPRDVHLVLHGVAAKRPMTLILRRRGGTWAAWRAADIPEHLRDAAVVRRVDASGLSLAGGRLGGKLTVLWQAALEKWQGRHPQTLERMLEPVPWVPGTWDVTHVGSDAGATCSQSFDLSARCNDDDEVLHLTLLRAVRGRDIELSCKRCPGGWTLAEAQPLPTRGGIIYAVTASQFKLSGNVLAGTVELDLRADPKARDPKVAEQAGKQVYRLRAAVVDGLVDATYVSDGKLGAVSDRAWGMVSKTAIAGTYAAAGARLRWAGDLSGRIRDAATAAAAVEAAFGPAPGAPAGDPAWSTAVRAAWVYRQICALELALRRYPLPLAEAWSAVGAEAPAPAKGADDSLKACLAALCGFARQGAADLQAGRKVPLDAAAPADPDFGPFFPSAPLAAADGKANVLPGPVARAVGQRWQFPTGWRCIGPYPAADTDELQALPEVVPGDGAVGRRGWLAVPQAGPDVAPPPEGDTGSGEMQRFAWFACADIHCPDDRTAWFAVQAFDRARLWVNNALAWAAAPDNDPARTAVFQAPLRKGANRLLVRCAGLPRGAWAHLKAVEYIESKYDAHPRGAVDFSSFRLHLCTAGEPRTAEGVRKHQALLAGLPDWPPTRPRGFRGDGTARYEQAEPPLAWNFADGTNIRWRTPLPPGTGDPVLIAGRLYVPAEPNRLFCLDAKTGKVAWERSADIPGRAADPAAAGRPCTSAVADDRHVWVHYGSGAAACFALDGTRKWIVDTHLPFRDRAAPSPVLAGGRLILQGASSEGRDHGWSIAAFDAQTGKALWLNDAVGGFGRGAAWVPLAGAAARLDVIATCAGQVLRADTGQVLHHDICGVEYHNTTPYVVGDVVYYTPIFGGTAVRLWLEGSDQVGARTLWRTRRVVGRGQASFRGAAKGPLLHDGLLCVTRVDTALTPGHYVCPWTQLDVYDSRTGRYVAQIRPVLPAALDPAVPPVLAGKYLLAIDGGSPPAALTADDRHGKVSVVSPGREPWVVATSRIDKMRAGPVLDGTHMYLRTADAAVCVAVTNEQGRAYQELAMLKQLLQMIGEKPDVPKVICLAAGQGPDPADKAPAVEVDGTVMPDKWLFLGPLPAQPDPDPLQALGGAAAARPEPGTQVTVAGKALAFRLLDDKFIRRQGSYRAIDIAGPVAGKPNTYAYYYTVLHSTKDQALRYDAPADTTTTWIAGQALRPKDVVQLSAGRFGLLVRVHLRPFPPFLRNKLAVAPTFTAVDDPLLAYKQWCRRVRRHKADLQRGADNVPGSGYAARARQHLRDLADAD